MKGANLFVRLAWVCAIISAFALVAIMISANVRDVDENPIVSSVDTIPVQVWINLCILGTVVYDGLSQKQFKNKCRTYPSLLLL